MEQHQLPERQNPRGGEAIGGMITLTVTAEVVTEHLMTGWQQCGDHTGICFVDRGIKR